MLISFVSVNSVCCEYAGIDCIGQTGSMFMHLVIVHLDPVSLCIGYVLVAVWHSVHCLVTSSILDDCINIISIFPLIFLFTENINFLTKRKVSVTLSSNRQPLKFIGLYYFSFEFSVQRHV
jgi:hypothetical protein